MANGLSRYEAWRQLLADGQTDRVLELVINDLDAAEARDVALSKRLFWILTVLVTILISLIGTGVLFGFGIAK